MTDPNIQADLLAKPSKTKKKDKAIKMAPPAQPVAKLPAMLQGLPATDSAAMAAAGMAGIVEKVMQDPSIDVTKVQALLDMQLQIWDRMAKMAFSRDYSAMSLEVPKIKKTKQVQYKNKETGKMENAFKHEVLEDIDDVVRPLLAKHGFAFSYTTRNREGGGLIAVGTLIHRDGHEKVAEIPLAIDTSGGKTNLQGMGSTASYGVRYLQKILLNIVTVDEDNDGAGDEPELIDNEKAVEIDLALAAKIKLHDADGKKETKDRFLKRFSIKTVQELKAKDYQEAMVLIAGIGQKPQQKKA